MFYLLSDLADVWGGGLRPNPLWLATASTTAIAALLPRHLHAWVVAGGAVGCIVAGRVIFGDDFAGLATPCLGNTAESALAVWLLPRVLTGDYSFGRTRRAIGWIATSAVASFVGAVIATSDTSSVVIDERIESMLRWTLGDLVGLLLLPPLAVAFRSPWVTPRGAHRVAEAVLTLALLAVLTALSFRSADPLPYVLAPCVMWLGIRFGPRLAQPAAAGAALAATALTADGRGPFAALDGSPVVQVQVLNVALALAALVSSAHAVRAWNDQQRLRATLEALPDVIVVSSPNAGRAESTWGPVELRAVVGDLLALEPTESDDPLAAIAPSAFAGPVIEHASGTVVEQRRARLDHERELLVFRDVTDRHAAETELRRAELRWRELAEAAYEGIARVDARGALVEVNRAFCEILGLEARDVIGHRVRSVLTDVDWSLLDGERARFVERVPSTFEMRLVRADGDGRWVRVTTKPDESGDTYRGGIFVVEDATGERRAEAARREAEARSVIAEQDERRRIARELHDGPIQELGAATLRLGALSREATVAGEELRSVEDLIRIATTDLRALLSDLVPTDITGRGLTGALQAVAERFDPSGSVVVDIRVDPDLVPPPAVAGAAFSIARECLVNALSHAQADRIDVIVEREADGLVVSVIDDGVGIPASDVTDGVPAGLQSVRERVAEHQGSIAVTRRMPNGTEIAVRLPGRP